MSCNRECVRMDNSLVRISYGSATISPYLLGYKYCEYCARFFKTGSNICECCNNPLRLTMKQINKYLKQARMHPEILSKLIQHTSRNQELRKRREKIEVEMRETTELILQAKN
jgi:hypothetical protein